MSVRKDRDALPTMWEVSDEMWGNFFLPLLKELDPAPKMGRPRADQRKCLADQRKCLNGMIYRARTGCRWNQLPEKFGNDSTAHRTVGRWEAKEIFDKVWALLLYHCEDLKDVHWEWQSADGCLHKARFIGSGSKGGIKLDSQRKGVPRPRRAARESVRTPVTEEKWVSKKASLSKDDAVRYLSASQEPM